MAKILKRRVPGTRNFTTRTVEGKTSEFPSRDKASVSSVRRLFARNPKSGIQEAASRGVNARFTNDAKVPQVNPTGRGGVVDGSSLRRNSVAAGIKRVVNRGPNRSLKKR